MLSTEFATNQGIKGLSLLGLLGVLLGLSVLVLAGKLRIKGWGVEKDFWTGSRGAASLPFLWTGETIFRKRLEESK